MTQLPEDREELIDLLDGLIAKRLLLKATGKMTPLGPPQRPVPEETTEVILPTDDGTEALSAEFAKVEKNLVSLGFFTPSSKRIKDAKAKTITINAVINGNRIEAKATIVPAALYGLPITADQDKYLALQKLITDLRQRQGERITNPIAFTSAELLHLLNQGDAGKNYREIDEWLNVMSSTTIISEGAVYFAGKKRFVKDRFHVFDRAVSFGKEIEPGIIADKNFIWFSDWQLENINNNYLIPVDLETYKLLRNHIAKTLVPLLQVWLFASRKEGAFEKRYDELCQILSIRQYQYLSRVKEQLGPSLDELQHHGYLASWSVEQTSSGKEYKLIFRHGEKFHRDRRRRLAAKEASQLEQTAPSTGLSAPKLNPSPRAARQAHLQLQPEVDQALLAELTSRGVGENGARKLLAKLPPNRPIRDLLEWGDREIARQPGKISNPAGFYIRLLEEHSTPPPTFESFAARNARLEAESARQQALQQQRETALQEEQAARQLAEAELAALPPQQHQALFTQAKAELIAQFPSMAAVFKAHPDSAIHDGAVRNRMRELITLGWRSKLSTVPPQPAEPVAPQAGQGSGALQSVAEQPQIAKTFPNSINIFSGLQAVLTTPQLPAPLIAQEPQPPHPEPTQFPGEPPLPDVPEPERPHPEQPPPSPPVQGPSPARQLAPDPGEA